MNDIDYKALEYLGGIVIRHASDYELIKDAYKEGYQAGSDQWVVLTDGYPVENKPLILYNNRIDILYHGYYYKNVFYRTHESSNYVLGVTNWMYIPKPKN